MEAVLVYIVSSYDSYDFKSILVFLLNKREKTSYANDQRLSWAPFSFPLYVLTLLDLYGEVSFLIYSVTNSLDTEDDKM